MARILFIEDHSSTRQICSRILRDQGYEVVEARNGRCALDLAQRNELDAVVTDWLLPDMDGLQFLDCLCRHDAGPPIIVFSNQLHLCPNAMHIARVQALIEKSEKLTDLLAALDAVCHTSKPNRESDTPGLRHNLPHVEPCSHHFHQSKAPQY